jgi:hypothetical protein
MLRQHTKRLITAINFVISVFVGPWQRSASRLYLFPLKTLQELLIEEKNQTQTINISAVRLRAYEC